MAGTNGNGAEQSNGAGSQRPGEQGSGKEGAGRQKASPGADRPGAQDLAAGAAGENGPREQMQHLAGETPPYPPLSYEERRASLGQRGAEFDHEPHRIELGHGLTNLDDGQMVPSRVDRDMLLPPAEEKPLGTGEVYAVNPTVQEAVNEIRGDAPAPERNAMTAIEGLLSGQGIVLGFSGYASERKPPDAYTLEEEGVEQVVQTLRQNGGTLDGVVDGGTSLGIPGISQLIASHEGIPTVGVVPLEGLRSLAPHDRVIVSGVQYGEETELLGTIPDVLVIVGGGPNAAKEYQAALQAESTVVILKRREYPPRSFANTYEEFPETHEARKSGRLIECNDPKDPDEIVRKLTALSTPDVQARLRATRERRLAKVRELLERPS